MFNKYIVKNDVTITHSSSKSILGKRVFCLDAVFNGCQDHGSTMDREGTMCVPKRSWMHLRKRQKTTAKKHSNKSFWHFRANYLFIILRTFVYIKVMSQ